MNGSTPARVGLGIVLGGQHGHILSSYKPYCRPTDLHRHGSGEELLEIEIFYLGKNVDPARSRVIAAQPQPRVIGVPEAEVRPLDPVPRVIFPPLAKHLNEGFHILPLGIGPNVKVMRSGANMMVPRLPANDQKENASRIQPS
jgi:hypothetical protein